MENLQSFRDDVSPDYFKPNLKGQNRTIFRAMDSCRFLSISPYVLQTNFTKKISSLPAFRAILAEFDLTNLLLQLDRSPHGRGRDPPRDTSGSSRFTSRARHFS